MTDREPRESVRPDEIRRIALHYVDHPRIRGDLRTHAGATGKCSSVSCDLIDDYRAAGYEARLIRFKGHRRDVPFPDPEGDKREEHLAVLVDGIVVDATRRQFDPDAAVPTIYPSVNAAGCHWLTVFENESARSMRALPAPDCTQHDD